MSARSMSSQEEKEKKMRRIRNHIAKDLRRDECKQRVVTPKKGEYKRKKYTIKHIEGEEEPLDLDLRWPFPERED
jgi:hypothetical protein